MRTAQILADGRPCRPHVYETLAPQHYEDILGSMRGSPRNHIYAAFARAFSSISSVMTVSYREVTGGQCIYKSKPRATRSATVRQRFLDKGMDRVPR
jgi:hypothetical protein